MPLKMAAVWLDASLETLWPLCYRGTQSLQGDLYRCFDEGSLQTVQVVVTPLASQVLQNSPQFIVQGFEVWTPRGPILGADKCRKVLPQPLLSRLGFWTGGESCWKIHFWPLKRVVLRGFKLLVAHPLDIFGNQFSHLSRKNEEVSPPDKTPHTKPWRRKSDGLSVTLELSPSPHGMFEHKSCRSGDCTAPRWWRFSRPWRKCFRVRSRPATGGDVLFLSVGSPSKWESFRPPAGCRVQIVPDEARHQSGRYVFLSGQGILFLEGISANPLLHCFHSGLSPHTPRASWPSPVFNTPQFLIRFNCPIDAFSWNF